MIKLFCLANLVIYLIRAKKLSKKVLANFQYCHKISQTHLFWQQILRQGVFCYQK